MINSLLDKLTSSGADCEVDDRAPALPAGVASSNMIDGRESEVIFPSETTGRGVK
jgi:hypothetical protein